jgi:hypothetical protein
MTTLFPEDEKTITQNLATGKGRETAVEERGESSPEQNQENEILTQGAELLEEPYQGSFISSLQMFVTWANDLLAKK